MFFSVGVETPKDDHTAYGITVPAFDRFDFGCVSAADTQSEIPVMAREAILAIVRESGGVYRDRSHFLAQAARHELSYK
ncbi:type II toxin-antitoxin system HicB family antitoxin [Escherichia coli]|nr:hypothetical protein [Shigella sonnei]MDF0974228.1 type II toxin-antitoxin system HicB family antitoxin [Escherichia coli]